MSEPAELLSLETVTAEDKILRLYVSLAVLSSTVETPFDSPSMVMSSAAAEHGLEADGLLHIDRVDDVGYSDLKDIVARGMVAYFTEQQRQKVTRDLRIQQRQKEHELNMLLAGHLRGRIRVKQLDDDHEPIIFDASKDRFVREATGKLDSGSMSFPHQQLFFQSKGLLFAAEGQSYVDVLGFKSFQPQISLKFLD